MSKSNWNPIHTAPSNTPILVHYRMGRHSCILNALLISSPDQQTGLHNLSEGWWEKNSWGRYTYSPLEVTPDLWQPLPEPEPPTWATYHELSEACIRESEGSDRPKELLLLAAEYEESALCRLDRNLARTLGATAVSAVALYVKAEQYEKASQLANACIEWVELPGFARGYLEAIAAKNFDWDEQSLQPLIGI